MRRALPVLVLVLLAAVAAPASARPAPKLLAGWKRNDFRVRPASIIYTGDGSGIAGGRRRTAAHRWGRIRWRHWGPRKAWGTGVVWLDDCRPNCAQGRFHAFGARFDALRVRRGRYTWLTLRYRVHGRRITDRRALVHQNGFAFWGFRGP